MLASIYDGICTLTNFLVFCPLKAMKLSESDMSGEETDTPSFLSLGVLFLYCIHGDT